MSVMNQNFIKSIWDKAYGRTMNHMLFNLSRDGMTLDTTEDNLSPDTKSSLHFISG